MIDIFREKLRVIPETVKASVTYVICNVLVRGISFITLPIFTRLLSTTEYGQLTLYSSWSELIALFGTITIWGGVFNTGIVRYEENRDCYASIVQGLGMTFSTLFCLIGIGLSRSISGLLRLNRFLTVCIFIHILALIPYNIWLSTRRFDYKYKTVVLVTIVNSVLNPILAYFAVTSSEVNKVEARVASGLFIECILGFALFAIIAVRGKVFYNKKIWKFVFLGNVILIPHYLSMQLLSHSDRLMIGKICGEEDVAVYGTAYSFAMLLSLVSTGIESSFTPYVYKSLRNEKIERIKVVGTAITIILATLCLALICVLPEVFEFMLPDSYHKALWCIPPVAIGAYYMFLSILFSCIEFYYGETKYVAIVSCTFALFNIILNWIFINWFGYIAAAYTTLISYMGICITHFYVMKTIQKKYNAKYELYDGKRIALISICFVFASLLVTVLYNKIIIRYIIIAIIMVIVMMKRKTLSQLFSGLLRKDA